MEQFGQYRLEELIGRGGMGEVYRAFDTVRGRRVALKRLVASLASDREFRARFQKESALASRLAEPHIIPIHDFGEIDGRLFLDMRLVEGRDLAQLLEDEGRLDPQRVGVVIGQVASALDAAHADGLVHRDVKPSNVLLTGRTGHDFVYLCDFGIARSIAGSPGTSLTVTGATVGTIDYMAPERFLEGSTDHRADVYALACLCFEALTGRRPFSGEGVAGMMNAHLYLAPPRPGTFVPGLPAALDAVVVAGMAKRPDDRPSSAGAFADAVLAALRAPAGGPPSAPSPAVETRLGSPGLVPGPAEGFTGGSRPPAAAAPPVSMPPRPAPAAQAPRPAPPRTPSQRTPSAPPWPAPRTPSPLHAHGAGPPVPQSPPSAAPPPGYAQPFAGGRPPPYGPPPGHGVPPGRPSALRTWLWAGAGIVAVVVVVVLVVVLVPAGTGTGPTGDPTAAPVTTGEDPAQDRGARPPTLPSGDADDDQRLWDAVGGDGIVWTGCTYTEPLGNALSRLGCDNVEPALALQIGFRSYATPSLLELDRVADQAQLTGTPGGCDAGGKFTGAVDGYDLVCGFTTYSDGTRYYQIGWSRPDLLLRGVLLDTDPALAWQWYSSHTPFPRPAG